MLKLLTGVICFSLMQESLWGSVWVSWGCGYKVPQNMWLKTTRMFCFPVLEARSLKSSYQQSQDPSESDKGASFLASANSEWLQANLGVSWLESHHPSLYLHYQVAVFCVSVCLCISHKDSSHIGFRAHPTPLWSPSNWLHFQQPNFQIKSHFELTGVRMYLLCGDTTLPIASPMASVNLRDVGTQTLSLLCYSTACDLDPAGSPQGPGWYGGRSWLLSLSTALDLVTWLLLSAWEPRDRGRASFQAATCS